MLEEVQWKRSVCFSGSQLFALYCCFIREQTAVLLGSSRITFLVSSLFSAFSFLRLDCLFLLFVIGYSYEEVSVEVLSLVGDWPA